LLPQGEADIVRLPFRDGTVVSTGLDLVEQDVARPTETGRGTEIPEASGGDGELIENKEVLAPGDLCDKLAQKRGDLLRG
jgi:hypothetical protein